MRSMLAATAVENFYFVPSVIREIALLFIIQDPTVWNCCLTVPRRKVNDSQPALTG